MSKKTLLKIGLYGQYYKKDIFDKYTFKNDSIIITNDAIDILDKPQEKLYIEPWTKKIEKDKEIERLKAREQECIDKYLVESKYRSEIEDKYVLAKYVIDELEKELNDLIMFNQSNIKYNHYTPDDWKDGKLIGNRLYKMKPVSLVAQELKNRLKELKENK